MKATKVSESAAEDKKVAEEDGEDSTAATEPPGETGDASSLSDTGLSSAQGLNLSTEGADASAANDTGNTEKNVGETTGAGGGGEMSFGKWILVLTLSVTLSGLLLMSVGAGLVYYFRRNWRRWGEEMADDED